MPPQQIQRSSKLLQIFNIRWVKQMAFFEKVEAVVDVALDPEDQGLQVESVLALFAVFFEEFVDEFEALLVLLSDEQNVYQPVGFFSLVEGLGAAININRLAINKHDILLILRTNNITRIPRIFRHLTSFIWQRQQRQAFILTPRLRLQPIIKPHIIVNVLTILRFENLLVVFQHFSEFKLQNSNELIITR